MVNNPLTTVSLSVGEDVSLYEAVIKTLLYFDIFRYPLREDEIYQYLGKRCAKEEVSAALKLLTEKKLVFQLNEFYSLQRSGEDVYRRVKGNELARKMLPLAQRRARLIAKFPFVRAVMASGSLSKGYMDEESDFDFFIITAPERLWITRMLLVLFKRIFLFNSHKYFCINYFITSTRLGIEERNLFTATELATVLPLVNWSAYEALINHNSWLYEYFPNYTARETEQHEEKRKGRIKKTAERLVNILGGGVLDDLCFAINKKVWSMAYRSRYNQKDFDIAFKSRKNASKNHPRNYQKKVTTLMEEKWSAFISKHNLNDL